MQTRTTDELAEGLHAYLTGYGNREPGNLDVLIAYDRWREIARAELERRAQEVIGRLDVDTLQAIARGDLQVERIAQRVRSELIGAES